MLGSMPFLVAVFGVPIAILALVPAVPIWNRLLRGRERSLGALYVQRGAAVALRGRLRALSLATIAGLVAVAIAVVVTIVAVFGPETSDAVPVAVGTGALSVAGLVFPALVPLPRAGTAAVADDVPWSRPERRVLSLVLGLAFLLAAWVVGTGVVSVLDPADGFRQSAYPEASVVDWRYSYDGVPKEVEWTPGGITPGWPGWFIGGPLLATTLVSAGLTVLILVRMHRWRPVELAEARDADDTSRLVLAVYTASVAAAGLLLGLALVTAMAGDVWTSVALEPRPQPDWRDVTKPVAYRQPLGLLGFVTRWLWPVLSLAALVALWLAVFSCRTLRRASVTMARVARSGHP